MKSETDPALPTEDPKLEQLASGRRIVNLCLFAWLAAAAFQIMQTPLAALLFLGLTVAAIIGTLRVSEGLAVSDSKRVLLVVGSCIPLVGLLVMAWFSGRAAKALRSAGYQVGVFVSRKGHVA